MRFHRVTGTSSRERDVLPRVMDAPARAIPQSPDGVVFSIEAGGVYDCLPRAQIWPAAVCHFWSLLPDVL
ncbi:hypothetical protein [Novipirellula galeiformis]|uniref:hypothetical protein n=1 Tax=Novipirellula galeiformis TaxID=2528004 RepID=UPI0011B672B4|nr:hypothetical protein [Novipirellula galeiformis]